MASTQVPTSSPPAITLALASSDTGNKASPGVASLACAALRAALLHRRLPPEPAPDAEDVEQGQHGIGPQQSRLVASHRHRQPAERSQQEDDEAGAGHPGAEVGGGQQHAADGGDGRDPVEHLVHGAANQRGAAMGSNFHLAAELDDPVGRQLEEFHRAFRVAQHPGEQPLAPDRHARPRRGQQGLAGKEEAGVHHLALAADALDLGQRRGDVDFLHEAVAQDDPEEAGAIILGLDALFVGRRTECPRSARSAA